MSIDYSKRGRASTAPQATRPVSLTKRGQAVNLSKSTAGIPFRFNLNWNPRPGGQGGGVLRRLAAAPAIDLDLGCLFELADGRKGVVQALGGSFGDLHGPPYIQLDKDDRSGTATDGENLLISSAHQAEIRRMVVYAFIYEGVANWSQADAVATIHQPDGAPITIRLDEHRDGQGMCAVAQLRGSGGGMELSREVVYFGGGHRELDAHYGWGMRWTRGRK